MAFSRRSYKHIGYKYVKAGIWKGMGSRMLKLQEQQAAKRGGRAAKDGMDCRHTLPDMLSAQQSNTDGAESRSGRARKSTTVMKIVATLLVAVLLVGCSGNSFPKKPAATQGMIAVSSKEFFEYFSALTMSYEAGQNKKLVEFQNDVDEDSGSAMTWRSILVETALSYALTEGYLLHLFNERGLALSDHEEATVQSQIDSYVSSVGGREEYELIIKRNGMSVSFFENSLRNNLRVERLLQSMRGEQGMTDEDLMQELEDRFIRVKHILLRTVDDVYMSLTDDEIEQKAETKDRLLKELDDGADFDTLMETYGEDPGMVANRQGYVIDQYVSFDYDFMAVAFSLDVEEVGVAEGFYGFHIIKRFPLRPEDMDAEYISSYTVGRTVGEVLTTELANAKLGDMIDSFREENEVERDNTVINQMVERYILEDKFVPERRSDSLSGVDNLEDVLGAENSDDE